MTATILDTLLTPMLFLRYGAAPLGRLVAETRRQGGVDSGGSASAKPIEAF